MKRIYSLILVIVALSGIQQVANAQPYKEKNHIAYSKVPTGPVDGIYTIHLDTFVTGEVTVSTTKLPADVVLVLDVSGSMDEAYSTTHYEDTARESQGYSYDNYGNNTYYYLYNGNYYEVNRNSQWVNIGTGRNPNWVQAYYLSVSLPSGGWWNTTYYLNGTELVGTLPTNITNSSDVIWTGELYERDLIEGQSKLEALQKAVGEFIDVIKTNAEENDVDNQIAIVKFAMNSYAPSKTSGVTRENDIAEGDDHDNNGYNYSQVVKGFTRVTENAQALKDAVNGLDAAGATAADYGMRKAELLLEDLNKNNPDRQSNKTVVLFTDGAPTYSDSFQNEVANNTISKAHTIKGIKAYTYKDEDNKDVIVYSSVFTVGVFDNETNRIKTYMHNTSSNYPNATNMTDGWRDGDNPSTKYYQIASDDTDLSSIFRSIASQAGGSEATEVTATAATTVDVVSQSFDLPYGSDVSKIGVYFATCEGRDENGFLYFDEDNLIANPAEGKEGHVTITIVGNKVTASGFDYSGNWCGKDESLGENKYHGMKLKLLIPIEMAEDAVGGQNVGTNGKDSGIYVDGVNICPFDIPEINLPTNLHIKKDIADGECATFLIYRKKLDADNWETSPFKTVIVIGGKNDNTVKLMGLDPTYLYKIEEAGWSWSYNLDHVEDFEGNTLEGEITSDKLVTNPFIFVNKKKDTKIRHAESAVYNDFRTSGAVQGIDSKAKNNSTTEEK